MDRTVCTPQLVQDLKGGESFSWHCLTRRETIDLTLLVATGAASGCAVLLVYLLITRNVVREHSRKGMRRPLIQQPMDIYMLSLLAADLVHALGTVMNAKWVAEGKSIIGTFCTAQGVVNHIGPTAVALNTIVIAVISFIAVWWDVGVPTGQPESVKFHLRVAWTVVAAMWLLVGALVIIPAGIYNKPSDLYWIPTPLWCTINQNYPLVRLFTKYIWLWLALFVSIVLYIPLSLWARGNITIQKTWWRFSIHPRGTNTDAEDMRGRRLFFGMIAYPFSNAILIIPLSVVRWVQLTRANHITSTDSTAVAIIFGFSGLTNVVILLYVRPNLLLFGGDVGPVFCKRCAEDPPRLGSPGGVADSVEMDDVEGYAAADGRR